MSFLEHANADQLPIHGGSATSIVVTMDADTLTEDVEHWQQQDTADDQNAGAARPHPGPSTPAPPRRRGKGFGWIGDVPLSAGAVRRLACNARIIPAVLGTDSEVLDLGRAHRLHQSHQRLAMAIRDKTCRAEGCTIPATWCEAHHLTPWSHGGETSIADGVCLCPHHHHRIHDPHYTWQQLPNGRFRFRKRP